MTKLIFRSATALSGGGLNILHKTFDIGTSQYDRFDFCINKERPDRYGDIVCVNGVRSPPSIIALWNYGHDVPIGTFFQASHRGDELQVESLLRLRVSRRRSTS